MNPCPHCGDKSEMPFCDCPMSQERTREEIKVMSSNCIGFEAFTAARKNAPFVYVRPYGIWHKGAAYWDAKLPRKKGAVVRIAEDTSGGVLSLMVFTMDGEFLCSAYPLDWCENEHPVQIEIMAAWNDLSPEEKKAAMGEEEGQ